MSKVETILNAKSEQTKSSSIPLNIYVKCSKNAKLLNICGYGNMPKTSLRHNHFVEISKSTLVEDLKKIIKSTKYLIRILFSSIINESIGDSITNATAKA